MERPSFSARDRAGGVDGGVGSVGPGGSRVLRIFRRSGRAFGFGARRRHRGRACGCGRTGAARGGELDAFWARRSRIRSRRRFRQPHALRHASEAAAEVGDAPADLGDAVAGGGERHDDVVVDLRHCRAVAGEALLAALVGVDDRHRARERSVASQESSVGPKLKLMRA
jgi:hypothetical protein